MTPFSLLIKPTSADCNLNCTYCFYLKKSRLYPETKRHRMSEAVLESMIAKYMATSQPAYYFGWQGGEPTLMGVDFFRKVVDLQKKYGRWGATVSNGLQTNAILINDDLAALFSRYRFLVGVSIDGPADIHDRYRQNSGRSGSHADVLKGIDCLLRHRVELNALVLVSSANVHRAEEVYRYLCEMGIHHHQYIPCVEFSAKGHKQSYAVSGKEWGDFLCKIFDRWIQKDARQVSVRNFDAIINHMIQGQYTVCHQAGNCSQYFVVEHNGDVYPCDFFVEPHRKLGNIAEHSWEELQRSPRYQGFGRQKSQWSAECTVCEYLRYCSGDCLKYRFHETRDPINRSFLCQGMKTFFRHTLHRFEKLVISFLNERATGRPGHPGQRIDRLPEINIRRKDPCYCGSGKPFKHCHGAGIRKKQRRSP